MNKMIIALAIFSFSLINLNQAIALELSTIDAVSSQGMQVKRGELTGAGFRIPIGKLAGLILPEGVLMKEDCAAFVLKNTIDPKISDIVKVKVEDQEIAASEFLGFVVY